MARLVTKFKYLKADQEKPIGGYATYIATREGVEKIDESFKLVLNAKLNDNINSSSIYFVRIQGEITIIFKLNCPGYSYYLLREITKKCI